MQYQIPQAKLFQSGASVQQGIPTLGSYPVAYRLAFHRPTTLYPFVEGTSGAVPRTDPIPAIISLPVFNYYKPEINRYTDANDVGRQTQTDGATRTATFPIPPAIVTQPTAHYYVPSINRYTDANDLGRQEQLDGPVVQKTFVHTPLSQPVFNYYVRDFNRHFDQNDLGRTAQTDGATVQDSTIFYPNQPQYRLRYQIPTPKLPIMTITAVVVQTFPNPTVSQVPGNYYVVDINRFTDTINGPVAQTDGATKQRTDPIPPVTTNYEQRYYTADQNRFNDFVTGPAERTEGATIQGTDPIPPVGQPDRARWYLPDENRFMDANDNGRQAQVDGATVQRTDPIPPVSQPQFRYYLPDVNRYNIENTGPINQLDGATKQQTYIFPPNEPLFNYYVRNTFAGLFFQMHFVSAAPQQNYIFPNGLPELNAYTGVANRLRYIVDTTKQLDQGAEVQQEYLFPPNQPEQNRYDLLKQVMRTLDQNDLGRLPQEGGAITQDWFIYPTNQYEKRYYVPDVNRYTDEVVKRFEGTPAQQTYIFPNGLPELSAYTAVANRNRYLVDAPRRVDGATIQDWFIYTPNQPQFRYYLPDANRYTDTTTGPVPQTDGGIKQQTYVFSPNEPDLARFSELQRNRYVVDAVKNFDRNPPQVQQTFFPNQPELAHWLERGNRQVTVDNLPLFDILFVGKYKYFVVKSFYGVSYILHDTLRTFTLTQKPIAAIKANLAATYYVVKLGEPNQNNIVKLDN